MICTMYTYNAAMVWKRYYVNRLRIKPWNNRKSALSQPGFRTKYRGPHLCVQWAGCGQESIMRVKLATESAPERKSSNCPHQSNIKDLNNGDLLQMRQIMFEVLEALLATVFISACSTRNFQEFEHADICSKLQLEFFPHISLPSACQKHLNPYNQQC